MKIIFFMLIALFSFPTFAAEKFELNTGCLWSKSAGHCVMSNPLPVPITCTVTATAITFSGNKINRTKTVLIAPKSFDDSARISALSNDFLVKVTAFAECE